MWELGIGVESSRVCSCTFGVWQSGVRVRDLGAGVEGSRVCSCNTFRIWGLGFEVQGSGFRVQHLNYRVEG